MANWLLYLIISIFTIPSASHACPNGRFGMKCLLDCHCKNVDSCDKVDGTCDRQGCADGYTGDNCQKACPKGRFGMKCLLDCHCKNVDSCDKVDGTCDRQGCADGYTGDNCQKACPTGKFGEGCQSVCHCKNRYSCDIANGKCDLYGCAVGYKGGNCQEACSAGHFGPGCVGVCHCQNEAPCDEMYGTCYRCETGYTGNNCQEGQCLSGNPPCKLRCHCYSLDLNPCPTGVRNGCATKRCERGWGGPLCQRSNVVLGSKNKRNAPVAVLGSSWPMFAMERAFDGIKTTSYRSHPETDLYLWVKLPSVGVVFSMKMYMIVTGNRSPNPVFTVRVSETSDFANSSLCYSGKVNSTLREYVVNCTEPRIGEFVRVQAQGRCSLILQELEIYRCSEYWFGYECDRLCNCRNATEVCDIISGKCRSGCPDGFTGTDCHSVCQRGHFGKDCALECHCRNVDSCNQIDGTCGRYRCADGYKGDNCQEECQQHRFGKYCLSECHCKNEDSCNKVDGTCDEDGCADGYKGDNCQEETSDDDSTAGGVVSASLGIVLFVIIVLTAVILFHTP